MPWWLLSDPGARTSWREGLLPFSDKELKAWGGQPHRLGTALGSGSVLPASWGRVFHGYFLTLAWKAHVMFSKIMWLIFTKWPRKPIPCLSSPFPLENFKRLSSRENKGQGFDFSCSTRLDDVCGAAPSDCSEPTWGCVTCKCFIPCSLFALNNVHRQTTWWKRNYQNLNPSEWQFQVERGISPYQVTHSLPPEAQRLDLYNTLATTLILTLTLQNAAFA